MRPVAFDYLDPTTVDEALSALAERGADASVLAGGQSLVPLLNLRLALPEAVIDINGVAGLDKIEVADDAVRVGAVVRARTLERSDEASGLLPVLRQTLHHVAHPQIRNRTTIGGNIAHADPSSELPAVLAALDGDVELTSRRGTRRVGWEEFFQGPFFTARQPDELLTAVTFPVPDGFRFRFAELSRRHGDYPIVAVCGGTRVSGGRIVAALLSATGVGGVPIRLREAESAFEGAEPSDPRAHVAAAAAARDAVDPPADLQGSSDFRRGVVGTLVRRILASLATEGTHDDA